MSQELAYALITPYSLYKSRTGGIIGRLLAHPSLELVGARMFVFSDEFVDAYQKIICPDAMDKGIDEAWHAYIDESLRKDNPWGVLPRCMLLLLRGEKAVRTLSRKLSVQIRPEAQCSISFDDEALFRKQDEQGLSPWWSFKEIK